MDSHPDTKEGANRFVVTSLQLHVTPVLELLDVVTPPKDSVTPSRDTTLPTARSHHRLKNTALLTIRRFLYKRAFESLILNLASRSSKYWNIDSSHMKSIQSGQFVRSFATINVWILQWWLVLPRVPSIRFGVILVCGNEVDLSLHEVCESSLCLPLNVQLCNEKYRHDRHISNKHKGYSSLNCSTLFKL